MSEAKLLSCPFCDSRAFIRQNKDVMKTYSAYCGNEDCPVSPKVSAYGKETVIKLWNTRKPMQKIVEKLEMLAEKHMALSENAGEKGFEKHMILEGGKGMAFELAIEIVKEEGGMND